MVSMALYLLKVCASVVAFYIPFMLVFKRTTFFAVNRMYLVLGLLLSFILPLYTGFTGIVPYAPASMPFMEPITSQSQTQAPRREFCLPKHQDCQNRYAGSVFIPEQRHFTAWFCRPRDFRA